MPKHKLWNGTAITTGGFKSADLLALKIEEWLKITHPEGIADPEGVAAFAKEVLGHVVWKNTVRELAPQPLGREDH